MYYPPSCSITFGFCSLQNIISFYIKYVWSYSRYTYLYTWIGVLLFGKSCYIIKAKLKFIFEAVSTVGHFQSKMRKNIGHFRLSLKIIIWFFDQFWWFFKYRANIFCKLLFQNNSLWCAGPQSTHASWHHIPNAVSTSTRHLIWSASFIIPRYCTYYMLATHARKAEKPKGKVIRKWVSSSPKKSHCIAPLLHSTY